MTVEQRNRIFIGGINDRVQKEDIEKEFGRFGKLTNVWVAQNPPGFAFAEFDHISEAEEAVSEMNGKNIFGSANKIRVEISHGGSRGRRRGPPISYNGGSSRSYDRGSGGGSFGGSNGGGYMSDRRDRYGSNNYDDNYRSGGRSGGNSYGGGSGGGGYRRDGYSGGGGGRYQEDRPRTFVSLSNGGGNAGRYSNGGNNQRYRTNSDDRSYNSGGGGGYNNRNRSRSPISRSGGSGKYGGRDYGSMQSY